MTASVLAVEKLGQAYIQASGVVLALKSAVTVQLIWASAVFDLGRRLAASGAVSVAQVADWLQGLLLRAKTAVDDAYADAVKRLDDAFADVEAECARLPTEALRTRPADMNRNKPGGTNASGLLSPAEKAEIAHRDTTSLGAGPPEHGMNYTRRWADGTTTAEDMEGVQHFGTHVPYGGSDLAQETIKQRRIDEQTLLDPYAKKPEKKEIKGPGERNYAAVRLANGEVIVRRSNDERRRSHSEQRIRDDLARRRAVIEAEGTSGWEKRERFKGLEVEELYTERQPCGSECQPEWDRAKTTWTFPWEPEDKRPDKYNTVRDVIKERA